MDSVRYIGLDVHRDTVSAAVLDQRGKLVMQSVVATRANAILDFLHRKNALLKSGNKGDLIDARKLAELLRNDALSAVYHGESSALEMQHRTRSYTTLTEDTTRVMSRLKALFRSQAITAGGKKLFRPQCRESYLAQLSSDGLRHRAQCLYQELDALQPLRRQAKRAMIAEGRKHPATKWLQSVPFLGKVRSAVLIGRVQTPHRFRTKRQFWAYCGLALETRDSAEYCVVRGQVQRRSKAVMIRGLNWNHNHDLKNLFKSTATMASVREGIFREFYHGLLSKGMRPEMARLTMARKIAAITLKIWKEGEQFHAEYVKPQAA